MHQIVDKGRRKNPTLLVPLQNWQNESDEQANAVENMFVLPDTTYASVAWGQTAKTNMAMLEVAKQKIVRQIVNGPW